MTAKLRARVQLVRLSLPRCPNHARLGPPATVVVGARAYCQNCAAFLLREVTS